jgi:hypothetical protein
VRSDRMIPSGNITYYFEVSPKNLGKDGYAGVRRVHRMGVRVWVGYGRRAGGEQEECRRSAGGVQEECRRSAGGVQEECRRSAGGVQEECRRRNTGGTQSGRNVGRARARDEQGKRE